MTITRTSTLAVFDAAKLQLLSLRDVLEAELTAAQAEIETVRVGHAEAAEEVCRLRTENASLREDAERERYGRIAWEETAARHARDADWLNGLLIKTARLLGDAAFTDDTGAVKPDPFVSKVPDLVGLLAGQRDDWKARCLLLEGRLKWTAGPEVPQDVIDTYNAALLAPVAAVSPSASSAGVPAPGAAADGPWVITRRDAHGRRFWGDDGEYVTTLRSAQRYATAASAAGAKPRGYKVARLADVPALLAEDARKPGRGRHVPLPDHAEDEAAEEARDFPDRSGGDLEDQIDRALSDAENADDARYDAAREDGAE